MTRVATIFGIAFVVAMSGAQPAQAQRWFNNPTSAGLVTVSDGWGGGFAWGGGGGTAAGNYLSGVADVVRARGEYNLNTSQAYINYEAARTRYLANKKMWTEIYFAMREQNRARQLEKIERARHSPETIVLAARSALPRPLSSEALDPLTGRIQWPEILQGDEYASYRERLEQLFEIRAETSDAPGVTAAIRGTTEEMIERLRSDIYSHETNDYIAARKFLESLAYSART